MKISFIIPAYNEEKYIERCIESIKKNWTPECLEIIVVDNASTDGTAKRAASIAGVKVVAEPKKGTNNARQRGLIEAKGDLVAYFDADTTMPHGWIPIVKEEFAKYPEIVSLSGPFHYYDLPPVQDFIAEFLWNLFARPTYWITGYMILGANFVVRRDALMKINGFDTSILFHGDDTDTARRLHDVGRVKFRFDFYILGSGRRLMQDGLLKTFVIYGLNYVWSAWKHKPYTEGYQDTTR